MRTEADATDAVNENATEEELPGQDGEADEEGRIDRVPISDLETLQELAGISGGCCICTLR